MAYITQAVLGGVMDKKFCILFISVRVHYPSIPTQQWRIGSIVTALWYGMQLLKNVMWSNPFLVRWCIAQWMRIRQNRWYSMLTYVISILTKTNYSIPAATLFKVKIISIDTIGNGMLINHEKGIWERFFLLVLKSKYISDMIKVFYGMS